MNIWQILEIDQTDDLSTIKQAYVKKLKQCKPETDPEGFKLLRTAYEIAGKYAAGDNVNQNIDLYDSPSENASNLDQEDSPLYSDPVQTANFLLDELLRDENDAIKLLVHLQENKYFDNLIYLESFQTTLVINLLAFTPRYLEFVRYVIYLFKLDEIQDYQSGNKFYSLALRNLINNSKAYDYTHKIRYYALIKDKDEAKQKQVDWSYCQAARILLNPINYGESLNILINNPKCAYAIASCLKDIEMNFPEVIGMGLNLSSVVWWKGVQRFGLGNYIFKRTFSIILTPFIFILKIIENLSTIKTFLILPFISLLFILYTYSDEISSLISSVPSEQNIQSSSNQQPIDMIPVKDSKIVVKDSKKITPVPGSKYLKVGQIKVAGINPVLYENHDYNPNAVFGTKMDVNLELKGDTNFDMGEITRITRKQLNQYIIETKLDISKIFETSLMKKLQDFTKSKAGHKLKEELIVDVNITRYGLGYMTNVKDKVQPVLKVTLILRRHKSILGKLDYSYLPLTKIGWTSQQIVGVPGLLNTVFESASDELAGNILEDFDNDILTKKLHVV